MKTDQELKLALADMLPENITPPSKELLRQHPDKYLLFFWKDNRSSITDREWLHVCWLVEQQFESKSFEYHNYFLELERISNHDPTRASWQQRAEALTEFKK